jgi:hypothetical protein
MNNKDEKLNIEDEVKRLKRDMFWVKAITTFVILTLSVLAVGGTCIHSKSHAKIAEIASKAGVECETKTNSLFGVMTKIKLVK